MMSAAESERPGVGHYLTPRQVAELIGKSADWVRRRVADGTMPHRYIGRDLRFIASEIHEWVDQQTRVKQRGVSPGVSPLSPKKERGSH